MVGNLSNAPCLLKYYRPGGSPLGHTYSILSGLSADQAGIQVDVNNGGAEVRGVSKIYVYKGSKKIKTFTSAATSKYTFTYKAKGAGSDTRKPTLC